MKRVAFLAGLGTGYLFATPSGRRELAKFKLWAIDVWQDPRVQDYVHEYEGKATALARQQGAALWQKAVDTRVERCPGRPQSSTGTKSSSSPFCTPTTRTSNAHDTQVTWLKPAL